MANRGRMATLDAVLALNQIDVIFYDHLAIRQKWAEIFAELERARTLEGAEQEMCFRRRDDLMAELIILMAASLGYDLPHTLVKGRRYNPQAFVDEENYQLAARRAILPLLNGEKPLIVKLQENQDNGQ
jgi:hypothetical protein